MKRFLAKRANDERGASLLIVIAFMVLVGAVSSAVISSSSSGIQQRVALDQARDRQYAADAGVETAVAAARVASGVCGTSPTTGTFNSIAIRVDCTSTPAVVVGDDGVPKLQKNLTFVACLDTSTACTSTTAIINAQVNFQGTSPSVKTYVQAWSVNK